MSARLRIASCMVCATLSLSKCAGFPSWLVDPLSGERFLAQWMDVCPLCRETGRVRLTVFVNARRNIVLSECDCPILRLFKLQGIAVILQIPPLKMSSDSSSDDEPPASDTVSAIRSTPAFKSLAVAASVDYQRLLLLCCIWHRFFCRIFLTNRFLSCAGYH